MKSLGNSYSPEKSPLHKRTTSIASNMAFADDAAMSSLGWILKAGTVLKCVTAGVPIEEDAGSGVVKGSGADSSGVLMHDVILEAGTLTYNVGVLLKGVVYDDVMLEANGGTIDTITKDALESHGILFYNVKTN